MAVDRHKKSPDVGMVVVDLFNLIVVPLGRTALWTAFLFLGIGYLVSCLARAMNTDSVPNNHFWLLPLRLVHLS